jgi:hypothetical protein
VYCIATLLGRGLQRKASERVFRCIRATCLGVCDTRRLFALFTSVLARYILDAIVFRIFVPAGKHVLLMLGLSTQNILEIYPATRLVSDHIE